MLIVLIEPMAEVILQRSLTAPVDQLLSYQWMTFLCKIDDLKPKSISKGMIFAQPHIWSNVLQQTEQVLHKQIDCGLCQGNSSLLTRRIKSADGLVWLTTDGSKAIAVFR